MYIYNDVTIFRLAGYNQR